jgi:hypothetical protein
MNTNIEDKDYESLFEHELKQMEADEKEDELLKVPKDQDFQMLLDENKEQIRKKCYIAGFIAVIILLSFYFGLVTLLESFEHAVQSFANIWILMSLLIAGFGFQIYLFTYIRQVTKLKKMAAISSRNTVATGGVSTVSMVACCAHHFVEVVPLLGISALAIFLTDFQIWFIVLAVLSNFLGMMLMFKIIKDHNLYNPNDKLFSWFRNWDMKEALKTMTAVSIVILFLFAVFLLIGDENVTYAEGLTTLEDNRNAVSVKATPLPFESNEQINIELKLDTHSVDLYYKLDEISLLEDSTGSTYKATKWNGSPPGGHHRSGTLTFPPVEGSTNYLKLTISDINGVDRVFTWNLQ